MLGTVQKLGVVLELFTAEQPEWGISEAASVLGMPKSGAHNLLATMAEIGLLQRTGESRYRLGWRILALSQVLLASVEWRRQARAVMEDLVASFGETAHLAALEAGRVVYVEKLEGTRAIRVANTGVGRELLAHCSGVGKVLLAHQPWAKVEQIIEQKGLPAFTANTITTVDELRTELEQVRERGFAYDLEEVVLELCCIAAPIRDHTGQVVAALSLSVPFYRFHESKDDYRRAILEAAREVSAWLGYTGEAIRWKRNNRST